MMKITALSVSFLALAVAAEDDTFMDDLGFQHRKRENPKLIMSAQLAVSFHHLGMPDEMLVAHYGLPFNRASLANEGGVTQFETDGQVEDITWLAQFDSITPQCWTGKGVAHGTCQSYFDGVDYDAVRALTVQPDFVVESPRFFAPEVAVNLTQISQTDFVFIDGAFEGGADCRPDKTQDNAGFLKDKCYRRSSAQILKRYEELAQFLGFQVSARAKQEKKEMCEASKRLQAAGKTAHEKGIRLMGGSSFDGINYITNPGQFHSIRSLEGLGLPILWPGKCPEVHSAEECYSFGPLPEGYEAVPMNKYFRNCEDGVVNAECAASGALYPVDFWVMEGTAYTELINGTLQEDFPDPAILKGQFHYLDANEGVISYRAITKYFDTFAEKLNSAENVNTDDGTCTPVDHSHMAEHNNHLDGGLPGGEFACYNTEYHDDYCEDDAIVESGSDISIATETGNGALQATQWLLFVAFVLGATMI